MSGLPTGQTLANFDFAFQPSLERSRIETLATCQWIRENRTLLIQGPPGVGKTHLSVALGVKAVEHRLRAVLRFKPIQSFGLDFPEDTPFIFFNKSGDGAKLTAHPPKISQRARNFSD